MASSSAWSCFASRARSVAVGVSRTPRRPCVAVGVYLCGAAPRVVFRWVASRCRIFLRSGRHGWRLSRNLVRSANDARAVSPTVCGWRRDAVGAADGVFWALALGVGPTGPLASAHFLSQRRPAAQRSRNEATSSKSSWLSWRWYPSRAWRCMLCPRRNVSNVSVSNRVHDRPYPRDSR